MKKNIIIISIIVFVCILSVSLIIILSNTKKEKKTIEKNTVLIIINGDSMSPTLTNNQKVEYKKTTDIKRYDIIVFKDENDNTLVKRVYALPKDNIVITGEKIYINNEEIIDKYESSKTNGEVNVTLGEDEYFVLGDNRQVSKDSRFFGPIKKDKIRGVIIDEK